MTLTEQWVDKSLRICRTKADFYSGCRKIIRSSRLTFKAFDDSLTMEDAGYTHMKMRALEKAYVHAESWEMAVQLWKQRRAQAKYGSVGFSCYNHLIKGHGHNAFWNRVNEKQYGTKTRASVMGPCIQSVCLTWVDKKTVAIDCFYRTTELFKKFPADLVFLRDKLLAPFDFDGMTVIEINFHFANITAHPMYWVTLVPHIEDPVAELIKIGEKDPYFRDWIVKWTARYTCSEYHRGIQKFAQAMRTRQAALRLIDAKKMGQLNRYMRDTHPGYRGQYVDPDDGDDE